MEIVIVKNGQGNPRACCLVVAEVAHNMANCSFIFQITKPILATPLPNPLITDHLGNTVYVLGSAVIEYRLNGRVTSGEFKVVGNADLEMPLRYDLVLAKSRTGIDEVNFRGRDQVVDEGETMNKKPKFT